MESTVAEDLQSQDQQSVAQYTDRKTMQSLQSPTHKMNPSQTVESLFAVESSNENQKRYMSERALDI